MEQNYVLATLCILPHPNVASSELSMGPFCVTRSNSTHHLTDPMQPNPTHYKWRNLDPTRPNPILLTIELKV